MRIAIPANVSPAAFQRRRADAHVVRFAGETMGTSWSVAATDASPEVRTEIEAVLARIVAQMSHWEPGSDLSRFNRSEPRWWQPLKPDFEHVLTAALEIAEAGGGAFDPAMGALADLWGFGPPGPRAGIPGDSEVAEALAQSNRANIEVGKGKVRRLSPIRLDFSGIAKGHAVDALAEMLRSMGHTDYLVEIGGELRGEGVKPDGQPWWVDLETPFGANFATIRVALHGLSIATSGDYRRTFTHAGRAYAHTLDPRTGRPLQNGVASVTMLHPCCMRADAWATALTVLGPEGMALAEKHNLAAHMVVRESDGFREYLSLALERMLAD